MWFADVDTAAQAALQEAAECSRNVRECGGVIFKRGQWYYFSPPIAGKSFGVDLEYAYASALPGEKVVADYHVHICSRHNVLFSEFFSEADTILNQGLHTTGYMLSLCDDNIRRFDPRQDDALDEEVDFVPHKDGTRHKPLYLTCGHITGWVNYRLADMRREWGV